MRDRHLTPRYPVLGKPPWAYIKHAWFPQNIWREGPWWFRVIYDCRGFPQDPWHRFSCTWEGKYGRESGWFWGHGSPTWYDFIGFDVIEDLRTVDMITNGCCPPQLLLNFLELEEAAAEETDVVEEAAELHKKGYGLRW